MEMVLGLTAALAEHVLAGGSPADMQRRVLPAVHVLLLWLALQPDLLGCVRAVQPHRSFRV